MAISAPEGATITYQLQRRSCGKCAMCRPGGPKHGPYWYGYFRDVNGKLKSFYIGKEKPEKAEEFFDAI